MLKCLVYGSGLIFHKNLPLLKYYELTGDIVVENVTSNDGIYNEIVGYSFVLKEELKTNNLVCQYDRIIIMADNPAYNCICKEIRELGYEDKRIIPYKVMGFVGFNFEKYMRLREHTPTIFAPNCWGGITYNTLGLPFNSPIINMFFNPDDYIRFLRNPEHYVNEKLSLIKMKYNEDIDIMYPVIQCGDIKLYFNHYASYDDAVNQWNKRKTRINWDDIFVMFYDENMKYFDEFSALPYKKKVFFGEKSNKNVKFLVPVGSSKIRKDEPLYNLVNRCARGEVLYYDVFDMLLDGDIQLVSKMRYS